MEPTDPSGNTTRTFATLDQALASLGIDYNSIGLEVISDGVYQVDSSVYNLNYCGGSQDDLDPTNLCDFCNGISAEALISTQGYTHAPSN
ncbi:hypothetical protein H2201_004274 [Coniosporium apollinis]|uniref:Uncharacterized protein n=2 Tax=Coniosporium TaxID=2810619 RepID=A0ABQ9NV36_9PEZI|nr:hypothetical protein H2199_000040 [Cladosporium sp. JES 115]KAJ9665583.1 hypothetical protein H2201_004274 [Coniosporium apollinis]